MSKTYIPKDYKSPLSVYRTQMAIGILKRIFEDKLSAALDLCRVSAPLIVAPGTGLNDDLNGVERAVSFDIKETGGYAQIVHSLAKWKRYALKKYGFPVGKGIYTDMNAIRRDEDMDNLHSIYVDQWDWEQVIDREHRNVEYLKQTVRAIVKCICDTQKEMHKLFPELTAELCSEVSFVTTQELEDMYPDLDSKGRENAYLREHKCAFIMGIGDKLKSGKPHDGRAPDYDDWTMNGDILFWSDILGCAVEVSSMGIRVDEAALDSQLNKANANERREMLFHKMLLSGELPLTMGGGVGQSRVCMMILEKAHVGEVQVSIWDDGTLKACEGTDAVIL